MTRTPERTVIVAHQFENLEQQFDADLLGMWLFLVTEALLFSGAFLALAVYYYQYHDTFATASRELHWLLAGVNSVILLTSGLAVVLAEQAADQGRRRATLLGLLATIALGLVFLAIKGYEYHSEYQAGLIPFLQQPFAYDGPAPHNAMLFYNFYFVLTGLHAAHMVIGLAVLMVIAVLSWRWRDSARVARQVRIAGLYWAFVDIVWVLVYCSLYLIGR
ncbi:Cytochrome c oxidase subunit 3 [Alcanivorax sp. ALC70]|nr:cytochrome c oxidase subunit 3 [Alcanivorax sp. ZXX171]QJX01755.1 cytochrome/quinol oxidase subunit 3 [Alcanivorax sp. IO_7]UWN48155.1 Cytochrome c oxidase subunit 3 [Alcanivorax sp. ALC70]